jgi:hypothetical protein
LRISAKADSALETAMERSSPSEADAAAPGDEVPDDGVGAPDGGAEPPPEEPSEPPLDRRASHHT